MTVLSEGRLLNVWPSQDGGGHYCHGRAGRWTVTLGAACGHSWARSRWLVYVLISVRQAPPCCMQVDVCIIAGKTGVEVRERPHPKKK